jgi:hypothetical protein
MPGVRCQLACQRRDRPAPRAIPGLTSAREGDEGNRPREEGPPGPGGGSRSVPRPPIPPCGWRGSRHGGQDAGRAPGCLPEAPPHAHARRVVSGMGLARRRVRPVGRRGNSRADGKCIPRVHAEGAFWHPGTRGGAARQKLCRACTRGASFLASGRWRWGSPSETPPHVYTRDEASDAGPPRRWRSPS